MISGVFGRVVLAFLLFYDESLFGYTSRLMENRELVNEFLVISSVELVDVE